MDEPSIVTTHFAEYIASIAVLFLAAMVAKQFTDDGFYQFAIAFVSCIASFFLFKAIF